MHTCLALCVVPATGSPCSLSFSDGGGYSGGGGASVGTVKDTKSGVKYFYKSAGTYKLDMLNAEYKGIKVNYYEIPVIVFAAGSCI